MTDAHTSTAAVATEKATRYMKQLCKHFGHKVPAEFDDTTGNVTFPYGTCRFSTNDNTLTMQASADDSEKLAQVQRVIDDHLLRFAFREELNINWQ